MTKMTEKKRRTKQIEQNTRTIRKGKYIYGNYKMYKEEIKAR